MTRTPHPSTAVLWARFRFSVVGSLLSSPPPRGKLRAALRSLAANTWRHPVTGREVRFAAVTIERWYYTARREKDDPVGVLRRAVRKDCGKVSLAPALAEHLFDQYRDHPQWSYKLHYDNLAALVKADPTLGPLRSYSTVRRYMQAHGLTRKPRPASKGRPGEARAAQRRQSREVRSYEAEYVGALWHLDFHHGSRKVLTECGQWQRPIALGILDDHSRLCCHLQWYLSETAEDLVHGLSQAIQKRGLPRALLTDNGPAMVGEPDARFSQPSDPGVGRNRVQPDRASRDLPLAGRAILSIARRAPIEPFDGRAARSVSAGGQEASTSQRRDDLALRRAFRGPGPLSPLP